MEPTKFLTKFECYPLMNSLNFVHQVGLLFAGASPGNSALCFGSLCVFPHVNLLLPWCVPSSVYTGAHNWLHKLVIPACGLQVLNPTFPIFVGRWKVKVKVAQSCDSLWPDGLHSLRDSPGLNTGVGSLSLLQGIFPTQGSNSGLPHCRWILYQLSDKGSPVGRYGDIKKPCHFHLPRIPFAFFWIPSCSNIIICSPNLFSYFFHIPCPSPQLNVTMWLVLAGETWVEVTGVTSQ